MREILAQKFMINSTLGLLKREVLNVEFYMNFNDPMLGPLKPEVLNIDISIA